MIGFNSGKYDLNVVKKYFVKKISDNKGEGAGMSIMKTCLLRRRKITICF